jgi:hypothetical protein
MHGLIRRLQDFNNRVFEILASAPSSGDSLHDFLRELIECNNGQFDVLFSGVLNLIVTDTV